MPFSKPLSKPKDSRFKSTKNKKLFLTIGLVVGLIIILTVAIVFNPSHIAMSNTDYNLVPLNSTAEAQEFNASNALSFAVKL
jgi:hypothetical protein